MAHVIRALAAFLSSEPVSLDSCPESYFDTVEVSSSSLGGPTKFLLQLPNCYVYCAGPFCLSSVLILHGDADQNVPFIQALLLRDRLKRSISLSR